MALFKKVLGDTGNLFKDCSLWHLKRRGCKTVGSGGLANWSKQVTDRMDNFWYCLKLPTTNTVFELYKGFV